MVDEHIRLTEEELRLRRRRSIALGLILVGLVVLIYLVTLVKFGPDVLNWAY
ncbi:MAG TPA: hypothetical protein VKN63_04545 [Afifellaceae bacterium]|nr:hypothetical protein [Afifellaceae bacterium]